MRPAQGWITIAALGGIAAAQAPAQQPALTMQQQFDAATAASAGTDKAAALAAWNALETRAAGNARTTAVVRIRKADVLFHLDRREEAAAAARAGLAALPMQDRTLDEDRYDGQMVLGRVARAALDYATAAAAFHAAGAIARSPGEKIAAALGEADTATFVDQAAAQAAIDRANAVLAIAKSAPAVRGAVALVQGVLLLNEGRFAEARKQSQAAVTLYGGLTDRTDLNDVAARSDTAIAAMLAGDADTAREYMAYTGAGRLPDGTFNPAVEMTPPDCGGEAGLKPADMAVVEFSVGDDGSVIEASPVYAAGGGAVALEFARAAQRWSWRPDQVQAMPRFFRYRARVEMRCSTSFTRPSVIDAMIVAAKRWLTDKGTTVADAPDTGAALALPAERAAFAGASGNGAIVASSLPLLDNPVLSAEERHAVATRALAAADGMPPLGRLYFDMTARSSAQVDGRRGKSFRIDLAALLGDPVYAGDPRARAAIRLLIAGTGDRRNAALAQTALQQVADDPALEKSDSLRIAALLQLSSIAQRSGDSAAAKTSFDRTGLTADQCALIDASPKFLSAGGTFPTEAMRWGFEGWTLTQFDIAANGHILNERAIISYPPFIFTKAGVDTMAGARYAATYRPGGGIGCCAQNQRVKFLLPNHH